MIFGILLKTGRNEVLPYLLLGSSQTPSLVVEPPCVSLPKGGLPNTLAQEAPPSITSFVSPRFAHSFVCGVCGVCVVRACERASVCVCVRVRGSD